MYIGGRNAQQTADPALFREAAGHRANNKQQALQLEYQQHQHEAYRQQDAYERKQYE